MVTVIEIHFISGEHDRMYIKHNTNYLTTTENGYLVTEDLSGNTLIINRQDIKYMLVKNNEN